MNELRSGVLILTGVLCFIFALGFLILLVQYLDQGAGLQFGGFIIGWIHVMGLLIGAGLSFAIGAGLCSHGMAKTPIKAMTSDNEEESI